MGGGWTQLLVQVIAALAVMIYSFVIAWLIGFAIEKTMGFRVKNEKRSRASTPRVHGEEGYVLADTRPERIGHSNPSKGVGRRQLPDPFHTLGQRDDQHPSSPHESTRTKSRGAPANADG